MPDYPADIYPRNVKTRKPPYARTRVALPPPSCREERQKPAPIRCTRALISEPYWTGFEQYMRVEKFVFAHRHGHFCFMARPTSHLSLDSLRVMPLLFCHQTRVPAPDPQKESDSGSSPSLDLRCLLHFCQVAVRLRARTIVIDYQRMVDRDVGCALIKIGHGIPARQH